MGHGASKRTSVERTSIQQASPLPDRDEDYSHLGSVIVKLSWLMANSRHPQEHQTDLVVTGKSALFHGTSIPLPSIVEGLASIKIFPREVPLLDSRATQLLITNCNGWHAISSPEVFSRHSGTCIIIGDRTSSDRIHSIKIGDCFRFGSVGVVVSEIKTPKGGEQRLDTRRLQYLREEALYFDCDQDEAILASEDEFNMKRTHYERGDDEDNDSVCRADGQAFCYMCYESHDTPEDRLVAPCDCKGDTRFLHVQCLQKWYQSSVVGPRALVIRTTANGAPACKICGVAYKTTFRNNGNKVNLLEVDHPGPYISLVVVTKHDTSVGLFNTKFRLHFGPGYRPGGGNVIEEDPDMTPSELTIGRSSTCNMVLDYRTVSTIHAKISYRNGEFFLQDARSSNGTMVYLQGPLALPHNQVVRLRMGRSTLAIQARRNWGASLRGLLKNNSHSSSNGVSLDTLQKILATNTAPQNLVVRNNSMDRMNALNSQASLGYVNRSKSMNSSVLPSDNIDSALILSGSRERRIFDTNRNGQNLNWMETDDDPVENDHQPHGFAIDQDDDDQRGGKSVLDENHEVEHLVSQQVVRNLLKPYVGDNSEAL